MKSRLAGGVVLVMCAAGFSAIAQSTTDQKEAATCNLRAVTVADTIEMVRLQGLHDVGRFSPDGKKFVAIVRRGVLERNSNEYSLLMWNTEEMFSSPQPATILTMSSTSNREAIRDLKWLSDSDRLVFVGANGEESQQLYELDVRTKLLRRLTNHGTDIRFYSVTLNAERVAFTAEEPNKPIFDATTRRKGITITDQRIDELVLNREHGKIQTSDTIFVQHVRSVTERAITVRTRRLSYIPYVSPDGRYVLALAPAITIRRLWLQYSDPVLHRYVEQGLIDQEYVGARAFVLIDTETGASRYLLDAPSTATRVPHAIWSPDSKSVVVTNVYLPLADVEANELAKRQVHTFAVEVGVENGKLSEISEDEDLRPMGWDATDRVTFEAPTRTESRMSGPIRTYQKAGDRWREIRDPRAGHLAVVLEEDMNTPPHLVAIDISTKRRKVLLDLNPQFGNLSFSRVEQIEWKSSDGHEEKAGLYYPVAYVPGRRYPMVIQTHGWNDKQFWIDGPLTTAFAAQPLAGKGIFVLQMDMRMQELATPNEGPGETAALESAIDHLSDKGLIDRNRVGIIAFSRTYYHVEYALTHSKYHFAAASLTDGFDAGYLQYILSVPSSAARTMERVNDAQPFGSGLQTWFERSPGFNLHRIQSPVLITAESPIVALYEWQLYAGLRALRKPVQLIVIEDGVHILEKPWDRMVSQQGNVDWFCFWLKGEEDPAPAKAEQYARWRELRKLQQENEKNSPAPSPN